MRNFAFPLLSLLASATLLLSGCGDSQPRAPVLGQAFVGPASLNLRQEINPRSQTVAIVRHGDALDIIQQRRRFIKVRTARGVEGWTDERMLMAHSEVQDIQRRSKESRRLPSQGQAFTYGTLNVHTEADRTSPSFLQVNEGDRVDVLGHKVAPRVSTAAHKPLLPPVPKIPRRRPEPKPQAKSFRTPPPPKPASPKLPADWLEISQSRRPPETPEPDSKKAAQSKEPVPMDDWTLIRLKSGQTGWVLTGRIFLAIPDEVAQYAEGRRITSYFSLGKIRDGDNEKDIWVWTTVSGLTMPYDFESFRVFVWSLRHHRYETAYIQRKVQGFYPVLLEKGDPLSGFSLCLATEDGKRLRQSFRMVENLVRAAGQKPCTEEDAAAPEVVDTDAARASEKEPEQFTERMKKRLGTLRQKFLKK